MTSDRHDPDATPRLSDEFWGEHAEWTPQRTPRAGRRGLGAAIVRSWDQLLGGGVTADRTHGEDVGSAPTDPDRFAERHEPAEGPDDEDVDAWIVEPEPQPERRGGVDPLLARFGVIAVIVTLAAPLVVGFTTSGDDRPAEASQLVVAGVTDGSLIDPPTTGARADTPPAAPVEPPASGEPASTTAETDAPSTSGPDPSDAASQTTESPLLAAAALVDQSSDAAPPTAAPVVTAPACGGRYELAAGDYWIRLADAAGVPLSELLAANNASVDTVLVPGRSICLPVGATTPAPPPTPAPAAVPTTAKPTVPSRAPTTTVASAPTTTARPSAVPQSLAAQIIRDIWPDELEERALEIAWRESNHRSNVNNSCCYGLFQIHWTAHRSWLATIGVTSAPQLFDPTVNATAALTLYQRSGGFGPWGG